MDKQVIFRDNQEQQAQDYKDEQGFITGTLGGLRMDCVTSTSRYAGFYTTKTSQTEVQISSGRFYQNTGKVFFMASLTTQSMNTFLPISRRIVTLYVTGAANDSRIEERDFLVDIDTQRTEPQAVPMLRTNDVVLGFQSGSDSADPQAPAVPVGAIAVANILLDAMQIVSVTMLTDNEVSSTEELNLRTGELEAWEARVNPRLSSLASDFAALQFKLSNLAKPPDLTQVHVDLARLKEWVEIPNEASDYGADRFLSTDSSDVDDDLLLGYNALVMEGCRFSADNEDIEPLQLFAQSDPNAMVWADLLLPAYDSVLRMGLQVWNSDIGIAQYGYQTFDLTEMTIARHRVRVGSTMTTCTNQAWWQSGYYDEASGIFHLLDQTWRVEFIPDAYGPRHLVRLTQFWTDDWSFSYWGYIANDHTINGAQIAQSFLNANDMWMTRIRLFFTAKGGNADVYVTVCECTLGVPDLDKVISHSLLPHTSMVVGGWTAVDIKPALLERGRHYAVVLTSQANHKVALGGTGTTGQQSFLEGTFFYSTDGAFYLGDLTKDMAMEIWGARFRAPQVLIELNALNLDGGLLNLDLLFGAATPASTMLLFETRAGSAGEWIPLAMDSRPFFMESPPLVRLRARFIGTTEMQPGLVVGAENSIAHFWRPKVAFRHVSTMQVLASAKNNVHVRVRLENFDDTPHDMSLKLAWGSPLVERNPTTVTTSTINVTEKHYYREFVFSGISPTISQFTIIMIGTTNSPSNTFHVAERVYWCL